MKGEVTEFDIPTPKSGAIGTAAGPDGNLWFCENKAGKIGCLSPAGKFTEYRVAEDSEPFLIIAGPDGNMWFTDEKDRIGHIRIQAGEKPQSAKQRYVLRTEGIACRSRKGQRSPCVHVNLSNLLLRTRHNAKP